MTYTYTKPISKYLAGSRRFNLLGLKIGRLLVLQVFDPLRWLCLCDCGNITTPRSPALSGKSCRSCGCLNLEKFRERITKHGETWEGGGKTPEYSAFHDAKQRCQASSHKWYPHYGGRGIEFRFESFDQFINEIGRRPSTAHSLDRKDNEGHYEPGNVQWATKTEQSRNTRISITLTIDGVTKGLYEWANETGTPWRTVYTRKQKRKWCDHCCVHNKSNQRCSHIGPTLRGKHPKRGKAFLAKRAAQKRITPN